MTRTRRWSAVALAAALLVAAPIAARSLPVEDSDEGASSVLARARAAVDGSWSGTIEIEGTLQLPDADRFGSVAALLGERSRLRAWWRDDQHWRVDRLAATGETDAVRDGETTLEWDYEHAEVTVSRDPDIRLPRAADLVPPVLAQRLLRGATDADVTRLPARRLLGRGAPGLRLEPSSRLSSIDHVDLWVDGDAGVPLLVEVFAVGDTEPAFTSRFTDFSADRPDADVIDFRPTPSTEVNYDDVLDIADAANQYAPVRPPAVVAGLERTAASDRAVGVYGEGATQVIAIPLRSREADAFRTQLAFTPGVEQDPERTVATVGPLGVLLTGADGDGGWLLAGTLTRASLERAGDDVLSGFTVVDDQ